jgi:hypothetical protein
MLYNLNQIWSAFWVCFESHGPISNIFRPSKKRTLSQEMMSRPPCDLLVSWESRRLGQRTSNKMSDFSWTNGDTNNKLTLEDGVKHHVSTNRRWGFKNRCKQHINTFRSTTLWNLRCNPLNVAMDSRGNSCSTFHYNPIIRVPVWFVKGVLEANKISDLWSWGLNMFEHETRMPTHSE